MAKTYGTHVTTITWCTGNNGGCVDRHLEIFTTNSGAKALLWDSSRKGWRSGTNKPIWNTFVKLDGADRAEKMKNYCMTQLDIPATCKIETPPEINFGTFTNFHRYYGF